MSDWKGILSLGVQCTVVQIETCKTAVNIEMNHGFLLESEISTAKDAANRWTDNVFSLKSWIKKKFPVDENQINKQFGIPEDLDYIT